MSAAGTWGAAALFAVAPLPGEQEGAPAQEPWSVQVAERATRAVVRVLAEGGGGSGFVLHPQGSVLTNDHVLAGAERGTV